MRKDTVFNHFFYVFVLFFFTSAIIYTPLSKREVNKKCFCFELWSVRICAEGGRKDNNLNNKTNYINDIAGIVYYF